MIKAALLARNKGININSNIKKQRICSDQAIVIKEILIDTPKEMIVTIVTEFGKIKSIKIQLIRLWQRAVVKFAKSDHTDLLVSRWSFLIRKNSVHMVKTFKALLFTLPMRTTAYNLGNLLNRTDRKTCFINYSLETDNRTYCTVVCFKSDKTLESAFLMELILGGVKLFWARLDLVQCKKCGRFGYSTLECNALVAFLSKLSKTFKKVVSNEHCLQLAKLYERKSVLISHLTAFNGKSWAQVVLLIGWSVSFCPISGFGFSSFGALGSNGDSSLVSTGNSFLNSYLASLKCSLELLADQVSSILKKLGFVELVLLVIFSCTPFLAIPTSLTSYLDIDMALNSVLTLFTPPFSAANNIVSDLSSSSSKFGIKNSSFGGLNQFSVEKIRSFVFWFGFFSSPFVSMNSLVWKVSMCNHIDVGNMISVVTETKLRGKVYLWIINKFDGFGYLDSSVAIIMNVSLVQYMCKVFEVPDQLISVKLLFRDKLLVTVLGLYARATLKKRLAYLHVINLIMAKTLNGSTFVVLSRNFNENDFGHSTSFKKFLDLGLLDSLQNVQKCIDFILVSNSLHSFFFNQYVYYPVEFFNFDYLVVSKYKVSNISEEVWKKFGELTLATALTTTALSGGVLYRRSCSSKNLVQEWWIIDLNFDQAVEFKRLLDIDYDKVLVEQSLVYFRKFYKSHKFSDSKTTKNSRIRAAIAKHMEAFANNKITLDYLVNNRDLVLEPDLVKDKQRQFAPLNYVNNSVFSGVIELIDSNEFLLVIKDLPDSKAAELSVKRHELLFGYWVDFKFVVKMGRIELNTGLTLYMAAGAFVDNTIWVGNCRTVTQNILNIASEFFDLMDISINVDKIVTISINPKTSNISLEISRSSILIMKADAFLPEILIYANDFVKNFGTSSAVGEAAVYFSDLNLHIGVEVYGLLSFTLAEMQAVVLALKCILAFFKVTVFFDSQAFLDACQTKLADLATSLGLVFLANVKEKFLMANVLCKRFIFKDWLMEAKASFENTKFTTCNLIEFVQGLIHVDKSLYNIVWSLSTRISGGVAYLLSIERDHITNFGLDVGCLFFAGVAGKVMVNIVV
ncbi:hypothetical protein G9A89_010974 [Geosiphon pyriformis]|nr:hypothetical protein G9A89_010974 [Geosiphon pyriformis]